MFDVIEDLLKDYRPKHSEFQIRNFIIGSQGSAWFKYKQCLREISSRNDALVNEKENLEIFDSKKPWFKWFGKISKIKRQKRIRQRKALLYAISETERELSAFVDMALDLKCSMGDIDDQKRAVLETEGWTQKARTMAGIDILTGGMSLSRQTIEMILMLPENKREILLAEIRSRPDPLLMIGS